MKLKTKIITALSGTSLISALGVFGASALVAPAVYGPPPDDPGTSAPSATTAPAETTAPAVSSHASAAADSVLDTFLKVAALLLIPIILIIGAIIFYKKSALEKKQKILIIVLGALVVLLILLVMSLIWFM